jgi:hypothetical protein
MPTGYTADIEKGITFKEYAMSCARNFGALVMMRDDPHDAEIPTEFEPSDYNSKALKKAQSELGALENISEDEAAILSINECDAENKMDDEYRIRKSELRKKYAAMRLQAAMWLAPSPDHQNLKEFMISQIDQSIKFDCPDYAYERKHPRSGKEWLQHKRERILKDIEYHTKGDREERERTRARNLWIQRLRDSLEEK